jgi:hypothetical protein
LKKGVIKVDFLKRMDYWVQLWIDLVCVIFAIITLTYFRPEWSISYSCWRARCILKAEARRREAVEQTRRKIRRA